MSSTEQAPVTPVWDLPVRGDTPPAPDPDLVARLSGIGSATACARLHNQGIRRTFVDGPTSMFPGKKVVGRALTLQFMPQREDIADGQTQEYIERSTALWAVLDRRSTD